MTYNAILNLTNNPSITLNFRTIFMSASGVCSFYGHNGVFSQFGPYHLPELLIVQRATI